MNKSKSKFSTNMKVAIVSSIVLIIIVLMIIFSCILFSKGYVLYDKNTHSDGYASYDWNTPKYCIGANNPICFQANNNITQGLLESYATHKNWKLINAMLLAETSEDIVKICEKENRASFSTCIMTAVSFACMYNMSKEECIDACKKITADEEDKDKIIITGERYNCFLRLKYKDDEEVIKYRDMAKADLPCNNINIESIRKNNDNTVSLTISSKYDFEAYNSYIGIHNNQENFNKVENIDEEKYSFKSNEETIIITSMKYTLDEEEINITFSCSQRGFEEEYKDARRYVLQKAFACNLQTQKCSSLNYE